MADVFHLGLTKQMVGGASLAIMPGDPARVERIARLLDDPVPLASTREFTSYRGLAAGEPVIVCSTGIGGPSTSIAVEELAQLGVRTFLRVGTTGAIQPGLDVGTIIVTTGAVRLDGASRHFAPLEFPAVSDFECTTALVAAARAAGTEPRVGITASADTFYPGQERYDTVSGRVMKELQGSLAEWQTLGVLNYEMESATLFTMCSTNGWRAGCVAGAIVNRHDQEIPDPEVIEETEALSIRVVVGAARLLLS
jgi:uridine phosphorylase